MNVTKDGFKDRQLHIEDYLQMVSAEQKEYAEVSAHQRIAENNDIITDFQTDNLMEQILHKDNLNKAYKKVKSNKGAGGVDGMSVDELLGFLRENQKQLIQKIKDGKYKPNPVRRVEISKETKGEFRKLGVPTVVDRVFQQAITQVLSPIYEKQFSVAELAKLGLFQKDLKKMYKGQIDTATSEVKRIEEENKRILNKAGCRSESELFAKQQTYDKNWSLCNTLAERNRSIKEECEGIIQEYAQLVRGAEGVLNNEGFGNNKLVDDMAEKTARNILKDMHGKDFSEYGFRDACIKAEMQLQNVDKDRSYERGVRIR